MMEYSSDNDESLSFDNLTSDSCIKLNDEIQFDNNSSSLIKSNDNELIESSQVDRLDQTNELMNSSCDLNLNNYSIENFANQSNDSMNQSDLNKMNDQKIYDDNEPNLEQIIDDGLEEFNFDELSKDNYKCLNLNSFQLFTAKTSLSYSNSQPNTTKMNTTTTNCEFDSSSLINQQNESTTNQMPTRRSNRQKDKETKTQLDKIKEENQKILKQNKEPQQQNKQSKITKETDRSTNVEQTIEQSSSITTNTSNSALVQSNEKSTQLIENVEQINKNNPDIPFIDKQSTENELTIKSTAINNELKTRGRKPKLISNDPIVITPSSRTQRQRKIPKRFEDGSFEVSGIGRLSNVSSTNSSFQSINNSLNTTKSAKKSTKKSTAIKSDEIELNQDNKIEKLKIEDNLNELIKEQEVTTTQIEEEIIQIEKEITQKEEEEKEAIIESNLDKQLIEEKKSSIDCDKLVEQQQTIEEINKCDQVINELIDKQDDVQNLEELKDKEQETIEIEVKKVEIEDQKEVSEQPTINEQIKISVEQSSISVEKPTISVEQPTISVDKQQISISLDNQKIEKSVEEEQQQQQQQQIAQSKDSIIERNEDKLEEKKNEDNDKKIESKSDKNEIDKCVNVNQQSVNLKEEEDDTIDDLNYTKEEINNFVENLFNKKPKKKLTKPTMPIDEPQSDSDSYGELKINEKPTLSTKKQSISTKKIITPAQKKKNYDKNSSSSLSDSDKPKRSVVKPSVLDNEMETSSDEEIDEDDAEWNSDDDPDKVWCICRKPHGNRFMIQCDSCRDWFHGSCVGITQLLGCQFEKQGKKWFCPPCRKAQENDRELIPVRRPAISTKNKISKQKLPQSPVKKHKLLIEAEKKRKSLGSIETQKRKSLDRSHEYDKNDLKKRRTSFNDQQQLVEKKSKKPLDRQAIMNKLSRSQSHNEDELKLIKLIQHKKQEVKKRTSSLSDTQHIRIDKNQDRKTSPPPQSPSVDSNQDSIKSDQLIKSASSKLDNDKKKKSSQMVDPLDELFKPAEPVIVQKTKKSIKRSNSTSTSEMITLICITINCKKPTQKINDKESIYCSKECLEKCVKESISVIRKNKLANAKTLSKKKSTEDEDKDKDKDNNRIPLVDRRTGQFLSVYEDKILGFILKNPTYEVLLSTARKNSTNDSSSKKIHLKSQSNQLSNVQSSLSKESSSSLSSINHASNNNKELSTDGKSKPKLVETETVRKNVKQSLKKAFYGRLENCKDLKMDRSEVKKIAYKIENELFNYFKQDVISSKYKTRFRSLLFNLNDTKNEGLFKKVLTNKLEPEKLVQMSSEELASPELAKWRERENRHSIEMIKKDAEQQAHQIVVKKTHKGEEVIETKVQIPQFDEPTKKPDLVNAKEENKLSSTIKPIQSNVQSSSFIAKVVSAKEKPSTNPLDLLFKDTTPEHDKHLFDLHCKICTNQAKEDLSLTNKPKPLSSFERQLLESRSEMMNNERFNADSNSSNKSSRQNESEHHHQTKNIHSCWSGYINMQEVSKFIAFAYKVSGLFEPQDIVDSIQVCGRIAPEQVFYYLKKIKSSSRNEVTILKFIPANDEEKVGYETFFTYLYKRNRFGVVGNSGRTVKDFYIFPLAKDQELDESMLPFDGYGAGLERVNQRPNYLLGLLVKRSSFSFAKEHHPKEHHDKSTIHYSPNANFTKVNVSSATNSTTTVVSPTNYQSQSNLPSHTPPKRSYTPPMSTSNSNNKRSITYEENSNSMNADVSYTPPRKDEDNQIDEPYDPEYHTLDAFEYTQSKKHKTNHHDDQIEEDSVDQSNKIFNDDKFKDSDEIEKDESKIKAQMPTTKNLENLLEHLSKNTKLSERDLTEVIAIEIGKILSIQEQNQLWNELKNKTKEFENQLEIKRKATENTFNQATTSGGNYFDSNVIPGLGDFSIDEDEANKLNKSTNTKNLLSNNLELPENLIKVLEKFDSVDDLAKANKLYDDPIVKNYGNLASKIEPLDHIDVISAQHEPSEELLDEPMELDDEENENTIIEVNNTAAPSTTLSSHQLDDDEEFKKKATLQINQLKEIEEKKKQQELLNSKQITDDSLSLDQTI